MFDNFKKMMKIEGGGKLPLIFGSRRNGYPRSVIAGYLLTGLCLVANVSGDVTNAWRGGEGVYGAATPRTKLRWSDFGRVVISNGFMRLRDRMAEADGSNPYNNAHKLTLNATVEVWGSGVFFPYLYANTGVKEIHGDGLITNDIPYSSGCVHYFDVSLGGVFTGKLGSELMVVQA